MHEEDPLPDPMRRQLDTLAAMAADLAGQFSLEPVLERILQHTMELLGGDSGSICTVDELAGTYRKEVDLGVGCQSGRTFPLDEAAEAERFLEQNTVEKAGTLAGKVVIAIA